jgi:hypothetical protein
LGFTLAQLKKIIESHGGSVATKVAEDTTALITTAKILEKKKAVAKVAAAREHKVGIVTVDWLFDLCHEFPEKKKEGETPLYSLEGGEELESRMIVSKVSKKRVEREGEGGGEAFVSRLRPQPVG